MAMMRLRSVFVLSIATLALAGCATVPVGGQDSLTGIGETAQAGPVGVRSNAIVEDSRCPMNARCVWGGRVVVDVTLTQAGRSIRANLILGEPRAVAGGSIMLDTVEPGRMTDESLTAADYRLHYSFTPTP